MEEIKDIKKFAANNAVPIMKDDGAEFICNFILQNNVKNILEIGTAIGYSAIRFAKLSSDIRVTTIERDIDKVIKAKQNFHDNGLEDRITIFGEDALLATDITGKYDLIFIDAAKAQYEKFFEKYKSNLAEGGVIVTDNLSFHGMVEDLSLTHNYSTIKLVKKIRKYIDFLKNNTEFHTTFYKVGDGVSISRKAQGELKAEFKVVMPEGSPDLEKAKNIFTGSTFTAVFCKDDKTVTSREKGLSPIIKLVESGEDFSGFTVCDKVVGRAAAFLYVLLGVKHVHAEVMCGLAIQILDKAQITYSAEKTVESILDDEGKLHYLEEAVIRSGSAKIALEDIKAAIKAGN